MEFYLAKENYVVFKDPPIRIESNFVESETSLKACFQLTEANQDEQNKRDFELLKTVVENHGFEDTNSIGGVKLEGRKCLPSKIQKTSTSPAKL